MLQKILKKLYCNEYKIDISRIKNNKKSYHIRRQKHWEPLNIKYFIKK